jgi:chromosome segregation ATPase
MPKPSVAEVRTAEKSWSQKIAQARQLRGDGQRLVYDRVALLCQVFDDQEFRAANALLDDTTAAELLDVEVADTCADFLELRAIFQRFPKRDQWAGKALNVLRAEMIQAERDERAARKATQQPEPESPRRRPTVAQLEQVEQEREEVVAKLEIIEREKEQVAAEREEVVAKLEHTRHRVETQSEQIERLLVENGELRAALKQAEKRIQELEARLAGK